jgi:hypothetical protein
MIKNKKKKISATDNKQIVQEYWDGLKLALIGGNSFLMIAAYHATIIERMRGELLHRYYSNDIIEKSSLEIIRTVGMIVVSNGDVLPQDVYRKFVNESWIRTIPMIVLSLIVFVILMYGYKIFLTIKKNCYNILRCRKEHNTVFKHRKKISQKHKGIIKKRRKKH